MVGPTLLGRLRALRDCGVLRAPMSDEALGQLVASGFAQRRYLVGPGRQAMMCDYRLTEFGKQYAERVLQ